MFSELGHDVIVANPRQVALIARSQRKTDRSDAEHLARFGRFEPRLLFPIRHRGATTQGDLQVLRSRDALVRARTALINHIRGAVKASSGIANRAQPGIAHFTNRHCRCLYHSMQTPFDLDQMATPLALGAKRLEQAVDAGNPREIFESALLLTEVTIKWSVTTGVSLLRDHDSARADTIAASVVRADSLGAWTTALRSCIRRLPSARSDEIRAWSASFAEKHSVEGQPETGPAVVTTGLRRIIESLGETDYNGLDRQRHSLLDLMNDCVFIRNRTRGHGAQLPDFFSRHAPEAAEAALELARSLPQSVAWWQRDADRPMDGQLIATPLIGLEPGGSASAAVAAYQGSDLVVVATADRALALEGIVELQLEPRAFMFANGRWNDSSAICQFLDYVTGKSASRERSAYAGAGRLPASETSPRKVLEWGNHCAHNLPAAPEAYVRREGLENRLRSVISDDRHRIVSLRGGGGMGKTALALRVLHDLVDGAEDFGFDFVLWFSARDIDLLEPGPRDRQRDVTDVVSMAESFAHLLEAEEPTPDAAVDFLLNEVSATGTEALRYLLVLDNMETFDEPAAVLRQLDDEVRLPSKVLVTSRHDDFQGDYPIRVAGMESREAHQLLISEARRKYCEPQLTEPVRDSLIHATGARAYALKLAVAQVARGTDPQEVQRQIAGRPDILAALFDRSFERLSDAGRFLYLLLGALRRGSDEVPLRAILTSRNRDFELAADDLITMSLGERERSGGSRAMHLVQMAQSHATQSLRGDVDELEISSAATQLRAWLTPSAGGTAVAAFVHNVLLQARESRGDPERTEQLVVIAESAAEAQPELWLDLAAELTDLEFPPDRARAAYKEAAENADYDDGAVWREWAEFESRQGDPEQSLYRAIRAVEADGSNLAYCSSVAAQLAAYISENRDSIPHSRRGFLVSSVRGALEEHRAKGTLSATDFSRLGWLYLIEFSGATNPDRALVEDAQRAALDGLAINVRSQYCADLLKLTKEELAKS